MKVASEGAPLVYVVVVVPWEPWEIGRRARAVNTELKAFGDKRFRPAAEAVPRRGGLKAASVGVPLVCDVVVVPWAP